MCMCVCLVCVGVVGSFGLTKTKPLGWHIVLKHSAQ